jgi:hypothetical protein
MAVGLPAKVSYVDGDVFSSSDINDTNGTLNLVGQTNNFYAGKNKIINGAFNVWQRGNTFNSAADNAYTADRWAYTFNGGGTRNITRETFTPGTAPVAGYEGEYYLKIDQTVAASGASIATLYTRIENARTLAGQTVTVSFFAKTDSNRTTSTASGLTQNFGTGGSPSGTVFTNAASTFSFTTSWQRYSFTVNLPSVSGKTFGTNNNSFLQLNIRLFLDTTFTFDIWGVQVEAGSTATAFQTATGTIQGELAACQRYYYRINADTLNSRFGVGHNLTTTVATFLTTFPVTMRIRPTALEQSGTATDYRVNHANTGTVCSAVPGFINANFTCAQTNLVVASGLTAGQGSNGGFATTDGFVGWSAEL